MNSIHEVDIFNQANSRLASMSSKSSAMAEK